MMEDLWLENPRKRKRSRRNPALAEYLLGANRPKRHGKRRRASSRRRHYALNRRQARSSPGIMSAMRNPMGMIFETGTALAGMLGTITVGNLIAQTALPTAQAFGTDLTSKIIRVGIRGGVAWAGDRFLPLGGQRQAYRIGTTLGVFGSFLLDLMGQSFTFGIGDQIVTPGSLVPAGFPGTGVYGAAGYMPRSVIAGHPAAVAGLQSYQPRQFLGNTPVQLGTAGRGRLAKQSEW